jgi:endonuclease/exonuclease/phosphatase (EEP) superfamily protein YafD
MGTIIKPCFSHPLTLLSWNIAMAQSSASAPDPAQRLRRINRLISDECALTTPHVLALQECPYPSWGGDQFDSLGYVSVGTQQSHCGYVDLLLQKELATNYQSIDLDELPSVACSVLLPDKSRVAISSSHLAPFKDGLSIRLQQCNSLMNSLTRECDNCILLGDFNMRAAEDETVENLCGGWTDAWKGCGSDFASKFTWNSFAK